jgi:hypothetical protein
VSIPAIAWGLQQRLNHPSAKFVLMILCNAARDVPSVSKASGKRWPPLHAYLSVASICQLTEHDRKTVMAGLHRLEAEGLIVRAGTDGQTNQVVVYALNLTGTRNGTASKAPASTKTGTGSYTENGTGTEIGTVPVSQANSTSFPGKQYQFSASPVPELGHETILNPIEPKEETKRETGERSAPKRRIPEDWQPSAKLIAWAQEQKPGIDMPAVVDKFRDYHLSTGEARASWDASFRTWIRNEKMPAQSRRNSQHSGFDRVDYTAGIGADGSLA